MSKRIINLGASVSGTNLIVNAVFWYPITSGAKTQTNGSLWSGASAVENTAIQNGTVLEEQQNYSFPLGTSGPAIEAQLLQAWINRNAQINGQGPALFANVFNDSVTGWSA